MIIAIIDLSVHLLLWGLVLRDRRAAASLVLGYFLIRFMPIRVIL